MTGPARKDSEMGELISFPRTPATEPEQDTHQRPGTGLDEVVDGELVPRADTALTRPKTGTRVTKTLDAVGRLVRRPEDGADVPPVRRGARATGVAAYRVARGHHVWARQASRALTHAVIREQITAARATGDRDALAEWTMRLEQAKTARRERLLGAPAAVLAAVKALLLAVVILAGVLLVLGVTVHLWAGGWTWGDWWAVVGGTLSTLGTVTVWALTVGLVAAPIGWAIAAYRAGGRGDMPTWALTPAQRVDAADVPITPSIVVTALRDLGLPKLRTAIKEMGDAGASMLSPIVLAGCGVEVDILLPSGVTTEEVQDKRRKLAENLGRHEHEVFILVAPAARTVRVWIADSGALDEPIGPSPLVIDPDMVADLYTGRAPWGQDLRGDLAAVSLLQRHLLITGLSNQGKTAALRALALWLALDTSVQFRIADLKGVGDWSMFDGLADVLIEGPTDEHVIEATHMLEWGVAEMERRLTLVKESGAANGVTRDMARSNRDFEPVVLIVDEAQQAFICPAVGGDKRPYGGTKATSRYFMAARKIHNQGRAVNVILWQGTQDPTDQNLPKLVREGAHIRASLVVGTESQARMALGDKAINGGAAPHKLRQGLDKGTLVVAGDGVPTPPGQAAVTIRTHFVDGEAADVIADRAKALRGGARRTADRIEGPARDLLVDLAAVLAEREAVPAADVPALLAAHAQKHEPYRTLSGKALVARLAELGVRVPSTGNRYPVREDLIREALARQLLDAE